MHAKGNIHLYRMFSIVVTLKMLDVGDLVRSEPDGHAGVIGRIKAADIDWCAAIVVEFDNWGEWVLLQV